VTVAGQVVAGTAGLTRVIRWLGVPAIETMISAEALHDAGTLDALLPGSGSA
jgi:hypothetical protein